jgi:hypothetical protein
MKKLTLGLTAAALALAGTAYAAPGDARNEAPRGGVTTKSDAEARAVKRFARLDVNQDGKIDAADRTQRRAARLDRRFERLDVNNDGQLSQVEFTARPVVAEGGRERGEMKQRPGRRQGAGMRMGGGRMADTDRDGAITQAEFTAAALHRFARLDSNQDGQVTDEERQSVRAEGQQRRHERMDRHRAAPPPSS